MMIIRLSDPVYNGMFFCFDKVTGIRQQIEDLQSGIVIVYGVGAAIFVNILIC